MTRKLPTLKINKKILSIRKILNYTYSVKENLLLLLLLLSYHIFKIINSE